MKVNYVENKKVHPLIGSTLTINSLFTKKSIFYLRGFGMYNLQKINIQVECVFLFFFIHANYSNTNSYDKPPWLVLRPNSSKCECEFDYSWWMVFVPVIRDFTKCFHILRGFTVLGRHLHYCTDSEDTW